VEPDERRCGDDDDRGPCEQEPRYEETTRDHVPRGAGYDIALLFAVRLQATAQLQRTWDREITTTVALYNER